MRGRPTAEDLVIVRAAALELAGEKTCPRCARILEPKIRADRVAAGADLVLGFVCPTCPRGTSPNECRCPGVRGPDPERGLSFFGV